MLDMAADPAKVRALRNHRTGSAMTRAPISLSPIVALAALLGACVPPPGYANPDIRADYTIGNHLFDVRAVRQTEGYDVYVAELGGPYLTDVVLLGDGYEANHLRALGRSRLSGFGATASLADSTGTPSALYASLMEPPHSGPLVPILRIDQVLGDRVALATWHEALSDSLSADLPHDLLGLWLYPREGGAVLLGPEALAQDDLAVPLPSPQLQPSQLGLIEEIVRDAGYASTA